METRFFDAIVIGSGTGGLTAAAFLSRHGRSVLVLEQHWVAGGNATTFTRDGFRFDVGLHYLGGCGPLGIIPRVLRTLGIDDVRFIELDPQGFDTLVFPDFTFRVPRGADAYRARLVEHFPHEIVGIDEYIAMLESIWAMQSIGAGGIGNAVRAAIHARHAIWNRNHTLQDFLDVYVTDPKLRAVIAAQNGDYAQPPSRASLLVHGMVIDGYLHGAYYPAGGAQAISDRLVKTIRAGRGEIRLGARATRILVDGGAVTGVEYTDLATGVQHVARAETVISDADIKETLLELVATQHLSGATLERTRAYTMSHALGVVYLGVRRDLRGTPNTNYWIHPGYDMEAVYANSVAGRFDPHPPCFIFSGSLRDPSDPSVAPPGHANLELVSIVPASPEAWGTTAAELAAGTYRDNPAYLRCKDEFAARLIAQAERVFPHLARDIVLQEVATPLTHTRFTHSSGGTSYGIALVPEQFLLHRPGPGTEIPGLYLCGASTVTGHGIPGTMMSGVLASAKVLGGGVLAEMRHSGSAANR